MGSGDGAPPCRAPEAGALASPSTASAASCAYPPQRPPSADLLTALVTRAIGPSPLSTLAEQRRGQARFVATPRCPADLLPALRAVRTVQAYGSWSSTSRT